MSYLGVIFNSQLLSVHFMHRTDITIEPIEA